MNRTVILIHGVGKHTPGSIENSTRKMLGAIDVKVDVREFNWCSYVPEMSYGRTLDHDGLKQLGSSLLRAAHLPATNSARESHKLSSLAYALLETVAFFGPVALLLSLLGCVGEWIAVGDPSWGALSGAARYPGVAAKLVLGDPAVLKTLTPSLAVWIGVLVVALPVSVSPHVFRGVPGQLQAAFRRALLVVLWPWIFLLGILGTVTAPLLLLGSALFVLLFAIAPFAFAAEAGLLRLLQELVLFCFIPMAVVVAAIFVSRVAFWVLRMPLKVLSDIFCYLGDDGHREQILDRLDREVWKARASNVDELVVVGHSLGSVIAVDYLMSKRGKWRDAPPVHLVTGGSPIRRFIHSFFPAQCAVPVYLAEALHRDINGFRWTNVYRPLDPIGGRLGDGSFAIRDVNTRQYRGLPSSHANYWSDPDVGSIVADAVAHPTPDPSGTAPAHQIGFFEGVRLTSSSTERLRWLLHRLLCFGPAALLVLFAPAPPFLAQSLRERKVQAIIERGVSVEIELRQQKRRVWHPDRYKNTEIFYEAFVPSKTSWLGVSRDIHNEYALGKLFGGPALERARTVSASAVLYGKIVLVSGCEGTSMTFMDRVSPFFVLFSASIAFGLGFLLRPKVGSFLCLDPTTWQARDPDPPRKKAVPWARRVRGRGKIRRSWKRK